jgi:hypothetical protein
VPIQGTTTACSPAATICRTVPTVIDRPVPMRSASMPHRRPVKARVARLTV